MKPKPKPTDENFTVQYEWIDPKTGQLKQGHSVAAGADVNEAWDRFQKQHPHVTVKAVFK